MHPSNTVDFGNLKNDVQCPWVLFSGRGFSDQDDVANGDVYPSHRSHLHAASSAGTPPSLNLPAERRARSGWIRQKMCPNRWAPPVCKNSTPPRDTAGPARNPIFSVAYGAPFLGIQLKICQGNQKVVDPLSVDPMTSGHFTTRVEKDLLREPLCPALFQFPTVGYIWRCVRCGRRNRP